MKRIEISKILGVVAVGTLLTGMQAIHGSAAYAQNASPVVSPGNGTPTGAAAASATAVNGTGSSSVNRRATAPATVSLEPILERAASMMHAARSRMSDAPSGARASYTTAANSFQRLFSVYGVNPGSVSRSNGAAVSSYQIANDIRTLRAAAKSVSGTRASNLQNIASLYATGAKEFFTAQVREALLGPNSLPPVVIRGDGRAARRSRVASVRTGSASSAVQQYPDATQPIPGEQPVVNPGTVSPDELLASTPYLSTSQVITGGYPAYIPPSDTIFPAGVNLGFGGNYNGPISLGPGVVLFPQYPYVGGPNAIISFNLPYGIPFPY